MNTQTPFKHLKKQETVLVGLSGGMKSALTAALIQNQGFLVKGLHLHFASVQKRYQTKFHTDCYEHSQLDAAMRVCEKLEIHLEVIDVEDLFESHVIDYVIHETLQNRLPNPCFSCHRLLRLDLLYQKAEELCCQWVATGHSAKIFHDKQKNRFHLQKGVDLKNDQSFFLYTLTQAHLKKTLLPMGTITSHLVFKLAEQLNLNTTLRCQDAVKASSLFSEEDSELSHQESKEIKQSETLKDHMKNNCFLGNPDWMDFIKERTPESLHLKGIIRLVEKQFLGQEGLAVGEHDGLYRFSVGQLFSHRIAGQDPKKKFFVTGFDFKNQVLVIGSEDQLFCKNALVTQVNWIRPIDQLHSFEGQAYLSASSPRGSPVSRPCKVLCYENKTAFLEFFEPVWAMIPGQVVVFYQDDELRGGGIIERVEPSV